VSDRELLELAAKAAGFTLWPEWDSAEEGIFLGKGCDGDMFVTWNPLTDDGDALRLAVKCNLIVKLRCNAMDCYPQGNGRKKSTEFFAHRPDHAEQYAATRRAITRAAAEIAKGEK
jgi:hypothetical protein